MLSAGNRFPNFALPNQDGKMTLLGDFAGHWLVVYFYPKDDTPGCTIQGKSMTATKADFDDAGIKVVGVSADDVASHKEFAEKHSLPFTILADPTKQTAKAYGVLITMMGVFELAQRDTFIIDPQGRIAKHWAKVEPKGHSELVLKELESLQAKASPVAAPAKTG